MERNGAAIVTGAGGGIGSAVAAALAADGMALVLTDRDADSLDSLAARLGDEVELDCVVGDVAEEALHHDLVARAERLGGLRVSVLNAGVYLPGLAWELSVEQWRLHVDVNLWGVVHGMRAAVPAMLAADRGHVVAVASGAGLVASPGLAPYVATKHAVVGLMESLHHDLAHVGANVHASVVCPGNVATPMAANSLAAAGIEDEHLSGPVEQIAATVRAGNAAGAPTSTVAEAIVHTLHEPRFWVLPQPEVAWGATDRFQRLSEGREPVDLLG